MPFLSPNQQRQSTEGNVTVKRAINWIHCQQKAISFALKQVSKTRYLTVNLLSADFAAASKNSRKNLCCLLKIDITSVIDADENEHTSR